MDNYDFSKPERVISWFSCGAPSTIATILTLKEFPDAIPVYIDTGAEHPDNLRYIKDVEKLIHKKITIIKSDKRKDHWEVIEKDKYINGVRGARCSLVLKKRVRLKFQKEDDLHVLGFTISEVKRTKRFELYNPGLETNYPLIDLGYTNDQCRGMVMKLGLEIPQMYLMGYHNNNCIGCVKGGAGYWNKIRIDFPEIFLRMASLERKIGRTCLKKQLDCPNGCLKKDKNKKCTECKGKGKITIRAYLDELDPREGNHRDTVIQCDFVCSDAPLEL